MAKPWRCRVRLHCWQRLRGPKGQWYRDAGAAERNGSIGTRKVPRPLRSADPASDHTSRYSPPLLVTLTGVAVAHRRLAPSSSATTSTVDRALPSSAVQLRCCSRPMTTTRLPLLTTNPAL